MGGNQMGIAFEYQSDLQLLILRVNGTPSEEQVAASRAKGANLTEFGNLSGMLLDLRKQTGSILNAQMARGILAQCDRHIATLGIDRPFPIAILTQPGSIGQGIARMFLGHAYGLERLQLKQCETMGEVADWLDLPPDWETRTQAC